MTDINRRDALALLSGAVLTSAVTTSPQAETKREPATSRNHQRCADLGNGTYLNPVVAGDHPDPSVVKDGQDYYLTFSTFTAYPALQLWHSRDLVNWQPLKPALHTNVGSIWAPELCKHAERYYLYFAAKHPQHNSVYVIWSDDIHGEWSEPIDLGLHHHIDPGHAVAEDGSRWLFLSGGDRIRLSADGLSTQGVIEHVYDPWRYPEEWNVESFSPEGPKIFRRGKYFYLITAVGGTAGPPTGHMVIAARSPSLHGPWEQHPRNPVVHTRSNDEAWWSRGHATLVQSPHGDWWAMYHGYEKGYWTLGRQCLLAPVTFGKDEWPEFGGGDLAKPIRKPQGGIAVPHGMTLTDDFSATRLRPQWQFFDPSSDEFKRIYLDGDGLQLKASGSSPRDSSPLLITAGDQAYEIECDIAIDDEARAGLLLFYDQQLYCGLGFDTKTFVTHQYGMERGKPAHSCGNRMRMRLRNDHHIVSLFTGTDGVNWQRFDRGMEVSGYHHNVRGGFLMLRPGLYAAGKGTARFRNFAYRSLP
jgi:beta-xylosidase